jgi:hypothetical protein
MSDHARRGDRWLATLEDWRLVLIGDHHQLQAVGRGGNQGDTVDVGIELVATQCGLYVGATRGRDDNKIIVVTESDDLDDACEVLRYVFASDRADIPATRQRRLLAEREWSVAPRRPKKAARCSIPPWYADLRSEVAHRLAAASKEVDVERQQVEDVHARIAVAKRSQAS